MRSQLTTLFALLVGLAAGLAAPPGAKLDTRVQRVPRPQLTAMTSGSSPNRAGLKVAAGAALGNILQGFNTGVIAGALVLIEPEFGLALRPAVTGLIASSTTFGAIAGTLGSSALADRAGRKRALAASCALFLLGGALMAWSPTAGVLVAGRFVGGTAAGLVSAAVPTYIAECAEPAWRGALSTLPQLCVSTGILLSYLVGLAALVGGAGWRLMLGASLVPACLQAAFVLSLPESPRWLLQKRGDAAAARAALVRLRGYDAVDAELAAMRGGLEREAKAEKKATGGGGGFGALDKRTLLICCTLQMFQQVR